MKYAQFLRPGVIAFALALSSCGEPGKSTQGGATKKADADKTGEHAHGNGPNGGVVFDLGNYHAEFTVDHNKKACTILILGEDEKTPVAVVAKDLMVATKVSKTKEGKVVPAMTIIMTPQNSTGGKATTYVGFDPGLGNVAEFEGTASGEIDGKPATGDFKE